MPTAFLSVSDKNGLIELGQSLKDMGWTLIASGGTARELASSGLEVRDVAEVTGAPEMLGFQSKAEWQYRLERAKKAGWKDIRGSDRRPFPRRSTSSGPNPFDCRKSPPKTARSTDSSLRAPIGRAPVISAGEIKNIKVKWRPEIQPTRRREKCYGG